MKSAIKFLATTAISIGLISGASAQSLFQDMALDDVPDSLLNGIDNENRSRLVTLDEDFADTMFAKTNPSDNLNLTLFPGRTVTLQNSGFDPFLGAGARAWSGKVDGLEGGGATLVYRGDRITGHIQFGSDIYRITPMGSGLHRIAEVDMSNLPPTSEPLLPPVSAGAENVDTKESPFGFVTAAFQPRIRVLFMFTPTAATEATAAGTSIRDEALLSLAMLNTAMDNTVLRTYKFKYAGIKGTYCGYNEDDHDYGHLLDSAVDGTTCVGARAAARRDEASADIVAILRKAGGQYCGLGYLIGGPNSGAFAYSISSRGNCFSVQVVAHEIGHNMGLHHDRYVVPNDSPTAYNYGLAFPNEPTPFTTIMAYSNACIDAGVGWCAPGLVFSNTHNKGKWNGIFTGRGLHLTDPAVNRKVLKENWTNVANYR